MKNHTARGNVRRRTPHPNRFVRKRSLRLEHLEARLLLAGDPLYRVNAGGPQLSGTPAWLEDNPSPYVNAASGNSMTSTTTATIDMTHSSVPAGTPMALFQSERFDKAGGANMLWDFPVTPGEYEVRLYFAETWSGAQAPGIRQFDVQIEGATVLDNYDVFADVGGFKGVVKSFTVTSNSNLDIDFLRVVQNPSIKGIEIIDNAPQPSNLVASTTSLDFGSVMTNTSQNMVVTLTNGGAAGSSSITIDPSQATITPAGSPYTVAFAGTQPIVLAPGQSTDVTVTYTPTTLTTDSATLDIPHSGANSPTSVSLTGTGVPQASNLVASTTSLNFGSVVTNTSQNMVVTLTNGGAAGSSDITIDPSQSTITPAGSPYTVAFAGTQPIVLAPGQSTNVSVTYTPTTETTDIATLDIPHSGVNSPVSVSLTGTGVTQASNLVASTTSLDFGSVVTNTSQNMVVTLTNGGAAGSANITIDPSQATITPAGSPYTVAFAGTQPIVLTPGQSTDVTVTYTPTTATTHIATLDIPHSGANSPTSVSLTGTGVPQANNLVASTTSLNFGTVVLNNPASHLIMLSHGGGVGSPDITIDPAQATLMPVGSPYTVAFEDTLPIVLSSGESTIVTVTYTPTAVATHNATLSIPHSGVNSPIDVSLTGTGVASIPINFTKSTLADTPLDRPTKVQFGPDGRLYVAQQNGLIRIYDIVKDGPNAYRVASNQNLTIIQNIPNHDDDGALNTTETKRLVTGLLVTGTAQNPVLYVTSSDPRIGAGASHEDLNLDTNSGILSRVTWNGSSWVKLDLVRGLPRSEENHASNGIALDAANNMIYIAQGGNANMGAPSQNFSLLPEYALSAAILSIDLDMIGETTYDLPTLDDEDHPGVDPNDPFGGNDGKNQAILVPNGPVQVYAPGFRNPYDVYFSTAGRLYATDNAPNAGWGGLPIGEGPGGNATNQPNESGSITLEDQLHYIPGPGHYFGHPNPTRSNPNNTFNVTNPQSPVALVGPSPIESDYLFPPGEDGALYTNPASTNGLDEYTATTFGGQMQGDLIIASFDNTVKRIKLNAAGDAVVLAQNLFSNVGVRPLDVEVADSGPWAGTIWIADIGLDDIFVYEPSAGGGGNPDDLDGDGYSNDDEAANGTDPNNAADVPPDYDLDFLSNLLDVDDDNDSQLDDVDPFAVDANNGTTTAIGTLYDWENEGADEGGLLGLGFTGLMTNGVDDYESLFDPAALTAGGAAGVFTIDSASAGTARGAINTQAQAFQFGVNVASATTPFTAKTSMAGPFGGLTPQPGQEMGLYIGTGDQDNYVQIVLSGDNGGSVQVMHEVGGVFTPVASQNLTLPGPGFVDLFLTIDPVALTVQASYVVDGGALINLGGPIGIPPALLTTVLAVGLIATDPTGSGAMPVTWDFLGVESGAPPSGDPEAFVRIEPPTGGIFTASTASTGSFSIINNSTGNLRIQSVTIDTTTALLPDVVFDPNGAAGDTGNGPPFTADTGAVETGLSSQSFGGAHDGGFDSLTVNFSDFNPGETFTFHVDVDPTSIKGAAPPGPSGAGHVSGLELTGSTVTVVFSGGTTTQTQTFRTAGNQKGSHTTADTDVPPAPGLQLVGTTTPPAVVTNPSQTLRITGPAGATARLIQVEASLHLAGVPGGGFDIDPFEANKAIKLSEGVLTIGAGGFVDVPVTLTRTEPEGGYNYFVAVIQDASGRTSNVSPKIALKLEDPVVQGSAARVNIYTNGSLSNSSTTTAGSFHILNQSTTGENITSVTINLNGSLLQDIVFDPNGSAGDTTGGQFSANSGAATTGLTGHSFGGPHDGGFDWLTINFIDFNPGETLTFSVDVDPTTIQGATSPGPQNSGSISGLEASGATITVQFSDGSTRSGEVFAGNGSSVNSHVILDSSVPVAPTLEMIGVPTTPTIVTNAAQTIRITGPQGATARLLQTEGALFLGGVPNGGFDIDPFETNKVIFTKHTTVTIGASGFVDVPVVLNDSHARGGINSFVAVIEDVDGQTSLVANQLVVALNDLPTGAPDYTGLLAGDYDGNGTVENWDFKAWKMAYGETGDGLFADGNGDEVIDAADYVVWRRNLGATLFEGGSWGSGMQLAQAQSASDLITTTSFETPLVDTAGAGATLRRPDRDVDRTSLRHVRESTELPTRPVTLKTKRLVSARLIKNVIESRSTDLLARVVDRALARQMARDEAFTSSEFDRDEITRSSPESLDGAWALAFEAIGVKTDPFGF